MLELGEETVLAEDWAFEVVDEVDPRKILRCVGNPGDFKRRLPALIGIGRGHLETRLEQ